MTVDEDTIDYILFRLEHEADNYRQDMKSTKRVADSAVTYQAEAERLQEYTYYKGLVEGIQIAIDLIKLVEEK